MSWERKYKLSSQKKEYGGITVYRVEALRDFSDVKKGQLGGWVEGEHNLDHSGDCWIYDNAMAIGNSNVTENATVRKQAEVTMNAFIRGNACVTDYADVFGDAVIEGNAYVSDSAVVWGNCFIQDNAKIVECSRVYELAIVGGNAVICGNALVGDRSTVLGNVHITDDVYLHGNVTLSGDNVISDDSEFITFDKWWERLHSVDENRYVTWTRKDKMWRTANSGMMVFCGDNDAFIEDCKQHYGERGEREAKRLVEYVKQIEDA